MKPRARHVIRVSMLLVLAIAFAVGTVHAQDQEKGDQPAKVDEQGSPMQGQGTMRSMGQMT